MKAKALSVARYIFGLALFIFGINGFLNFMPVPPMAPEAGALLGAFAKTGYFFPLIKTIETVVGLLLLVNLFVPLALVLITPVLVGITTIHLFLNPGGIPTMVVFHLFHGFLVLGYWSYFKSVLTVRANIG